MRPIASAFDDDMWEDFIADESGVLRPFISPRARQPRCTAENAVPADLPAPSVARGPPLTPPDRRHAGARGGCEGMVPMGAKPVSTGSSYSLAAAASHRQDAAGWIRPPPGLELTAGSDRDADLESEPETASDGEEPIQVLVGPSPLSVKGLAHNLEELWLRSGPRRRHYIRSSASAVWLSETKMLSDARPGDTPLSFGSIVHLRAGWQQCRPCMFQKNSKRVCRRSWLCDFCHMHTKPSSPAKALSRRDAQPEYGQAFGRLESTATASTDLGVFTLSALSSLGDLPAMHGATATVSTLGTLPDVA
uniref:Uncharacterized protein n=1 Tax=Zooxanthella nutricula TaxID=1333877 RepID=A0A7S2KEX4_9DINO